MSTAATDHPAGEAGFTLVETLVALFVFALAGVALIVLQTQSVRSLSRVEEQALASLVAENQLVDVMARHGAPDLGGRDGEIKLGGRTWRWRLEISATEDPSTVRVLAKAFAPEAEDASASVSAFMVSGGAQ